MPIKITQSKEELDLFSKVSESDLDLKFFSESLTSIKQNTATQVGSAAKKIYLPKTSLILIVLALFIMSNIWVFFILMKGFMSDVEILARLTSPEVLLYNRLISEKVMMALIAATTTQVGGAFLLIARYLIKVR